MIWAVLQQDLWILIFVCVCRVVWPDEHQWTKLYDVELDDLDI